MMIVEVAVLIALSAKCPLASMADASTLASLKPIVDVPSMVLPVIMADLAYRAPAFVTANVFVSAPARVAFPDHMFPLVSTLNQLGVVPTDRLPPTNVNPVRVPATT